MKIRYSVKNLRAIQYMDPVELRPITILVGANSSGKSTFLRSFLLLKQSLANLTEEPILWYGDNVDFGDFTTSVHDNKKKNEMAFRFEILDFEPSLYYEAAKNIAGKYTQEKKKILGKISYNVHLKSSNGNTVVSKYELIIEELDINLSICLEKKTIMLYLNYGNLSVKEKLSDFVFMDAGKLFPDIQFYDKSTKNTEPICYSQSSLYFRKKLSESIGGISIKNINNQIIDLLLKIPMVDLDNKNKSSRIKNISSRNVLYEILHKEKRIDEMKEVDRCCALNFMLSAFQEVSKIIRDFVLSTTSVGPVRILGQRYYRFQEYDLANVSAGGHNFPMILASLKDKGSLQKFSKWAKELIGYDVDIEKLQGTFNVMVGDGKRKENLADTGYGVSQLLPVLAQIWLTVNPDFRGSSQPRMVPKQNGLRLVSIEEPMLHLHPKFQASMADAFASTVSRSSYAGQKPIFIVETHSEVMLNRLGELIELKQLDAEDVQVVLFSKGTSNSIAAVVRTSTYTDDGILRDWPYGFFRY